MEYLIISTLSKDDENVKTTISELRKNLKDIEIIYTEQMNIKGCIGCNNCWLKTPGKCSINDDYEQILIKILQYQKVIFITDTKFGFISYKLKNIIDRFLPFATMYLKFEKGQMRHYSRYKKIFKMGIIYTGNGNKEFLKHWLERVMINYHGISLGVCEMNDRGDFYNALVNN